MKKIHIIHSESEIQYAQFTNEYLTPDELSKLNGGYMFCKSKVVCDDFDGDASGCGRFKCGNVSCSQLVECHVYN